MANILIVGDGAIGLLFSRFLGGEILPSNTASNSTTSSSTTSNSTTFNPKNDHHIYLLTRKNTQSPRHYIDDQGITHTIKASCITFNQLSNIPAIDIIIFAVKAFQVHNLFVQIQAFIPSHCSIVISHNGMGNTEELKTKINKNQALYFLTTNMAGFKKDAYTVQHTGNGKSVIGGCNQTGRKNINTIQLILTKIPQLATTSHIEKLRFEKLLINIAINPLSALYNINNGQLREPKYQTVITQLLAEACKIAQAKGFDFNLQTSLDNAHAVMALTQKNYSSMQQDISHNRPTEIMAICGYISQQGKHHKIKTPCNDKVTNKILALS